MNSMMLVVALSAGQGPGGYYPPPGAQYPAQRIGAQPAVLPNGFPTQPTGVPVQPVPMPMQPDQQPMTGNGTDQKEEPPKEPAKDEPETAANAPPVYLLERSLRDTWLGKKMTDHNIRLYGWTAMSYTVGTTSFSNAPMYFNDQPNHFQMNQNWLHFEKAIDTSKDEFQWGWVTDGIIPGTDARTTIARHLFDGQLVSHAPWTNGAVPPAPVGTSSAYPFDLYQAYGQVFLPNLGGKGTTVQVGRFQTIIGYEMVQAVLTPFVSKSYLFEYNPFTHTGAFATTQLNDTWAVGYGGVLGADNWFGNTDKFTYLGQIKWTPKDRKISAIGNVLLTDPTYDTAHAFARYNVYNAVVTYNFTDKTSYVLDTTYSHMDGVPGVSGAAFWYGGANYLIHKFTDKLTGTVRAELFDDVKGVRTGFSGLYTEVTAGFAWAPKPGLIFRPSVRYDNNSSSTPFDGGVSSSMWTGAFEMILRW
jgi:hypothetical protein